MRLGRLLLAGALGCLLAAGFAPAVWAATTYPAEQSNNTATCVAASPTAPADCAGPFTGQTDNRSGIETPLFDPPGGNVSADNVRDLLYPGSTTKVFVNMMLGFCTPADGSSSPGVPRCNSNVLTQYTSDNTATVDAHLADLARRGIDGMVMTWYGPGTSVNDATLKYQAEIHNRGYCAMGSWHCQLTYLNMYDGSTLKWAVTPTGIEGTSGEACATTAEKSVAEPCIVRRMKNDLCYMNGYHFGDDAYAKYQGQPMVQFFIDEGDPSHPGSGLFPNLPRDGAAPSWADVWDQIRQWTNDLPTNCGADPYNKRNARPLLLFENTPGFTHAQSDGAFDWINPDPQNQDGLMISPVDKGGTVDNFYHVSQGYLSSKVVWGVAYKGFDNVQAAWGNPAVVDQWCGQTWVKSLASAGNMGYSATQQLPFVQIATWNDHNEGTSIETGIDNCYRVSAVVSGSTLTWQANPTRDKADGSTISRWLVFDSTDGGSSYQQIAALPGSARSVDLGGLPAGTHQLFVKMVGRADILNQVSGTVTFTQTGSPPGNRVDEQVQFLANHQLPDGALLGPGNSINPYFADLAAVGLARADTPTADTVLYQWMRWHLDHLNPGDSNGLVDTIDNYTYDPGTGTETSTGRYDAVDSYAGTALSMAYTAYLTGDPRIQTLVSANIGRYEGVASLLVEHIEDGGVRADDVLTESMPSFGNQYAMNNSEVAAGLGDLGHLEALLGRTDQSNFYQGWHDTSAAYVLNMLWDSAHNYWDFATWTATDPAATFHPDATAQLWPTLFGVVTPDSPQAIAAWQAFTTAYPSWYTDAVPDAYPWTAMARVAELMGDWTHAGQLLDTVHDRYAPGWGGNWYDDEAGWFLLAATGTDP